MFACSTVRPSLVCFNAAQEQHHALHSRPHGALNQNRMALTAEMNCQKRRHSLRPRPTPRPSANRSRPAIPTPVLHIRVQYRLLPMWPSLRGVVGMPNSISPCTHAADELAADTTCVPACTHAYKANHLRPNPIAQSISHILRQARRRSCYSALHTRRPSFKTQRGPTVTTLSMH